MLENITEYPEFNLTNNSLRDGGPANIGPGVWTWLLSVCLFVTSLATLLGNGLVVVTFVSNKKLLMSNFNMFLLSLTVTDIAVSVTAIPLFGLQYLFGHWPLGSTLCSVWVFCDWGMTFASVYILLAISVDRWWAVCWSHHYKAHNTRRRTILTITIVWMLVLVLWLPPYINDRIINSRENSTECGWMVERAGNMGFAIFMAVAGYHVPSIIIVYCYIRVFVNMRKSHKNLNKKKAVVKVSWSGSKQPSRSTFTLDSSRESYQSSDSEGGSEPKDPNRLKTSDDTASDRGQKDVLNHSSVQITISRVDQNGACNLCLTDHRPVDDASLDIGDFRTRSNSLDNILCRKHGLLTTSELSEDEMTPPGSHLSLEITSPTATTRRKRRPVSFTEGTLPRRMFKKRRRHQYFGPVNSADFTSRVKHASTASQMTSASRGTSSDNKEYKLFVRVSYIIVAYLVCWTPFHVVFDCQLAGVPINDNLYTFAVLMCYLNSTLNPVLYALGNPKLKAAFLDTLRCATCKKT